jgi:UDP-N-acetylglucosamine--N-acetylmuramyl-(pentapeptide) pyrophosphoryl-undecaprenol N-acetylglucosamine transferase
MRILLTGGGSGGHFYPVIAVAEAINRYAKENKLIDVELYYMAPQPYDTELLAANGITFIPIAAGKMRRYFSLMNIFDVFKTMWGTFRAIWKLFILYPDVIFGKGGYVSFPAMFAAKILRIPVVIHESDSAPGKVNKWAGKFARKIALSFPQAAEYFNKDKVAYTGNPIRQEVTHADRSGGREYLKLEQNLPVVLILGGSQGSQIMNENILDSLQKLVEQYQILHQTGPNNLHLVQETAGIVLQSSQYKQRYHPVAQFDALALRMAAGAADVVISRAGSTIFEIAAWGVPAILIPISKSNEDHQRKNAYNYARTGAAIVIEENNLTPNILISEIHRLLEDKTGLEKMRNAAQSFAKADAADTIAAALVEICLEHE